MFDGRRTLRVIAIASSAVVVVALGSEPSQAVSASSSPAPEATYLVQLDGLPTASYAGGVKGIAGTKPATGHKLNPKASNFQAYQRHLQQSRSTVLKAARVNASQQITSYQTVFNGFAARLTAADVARLQHTPGVLHVYKDTIVRAQSVATPQFLGLDGEKGVWQTQFGGVAHAGEGEIIGVIDSGFWPEAASFAPLSTPRPDQAQIDAKWHGTCDTGIDNPVACNNKVIGARYYYPSDPTGILPAEFKSPRDYEGHGTHTSSTAAGNSGVETTVAGTSFGQASGMAPSARLAEYKALWATPDGSASGSTAGIVQAIDDATADGVDVINFSVGSTPGTIDPIDLAMLNAAAAGVFVSASAGNSGPTAGTVDNDMPWETTVAASTRDISFAKTVKLGNGASYTGVGLGAAVPSAPLVDAVAVTAKGKSVADAELCKLDSLDPAKVKGAIVLCKRGVNARVEKSLAVQKAGGVGVVLYNDPDNSLNADLHSVPTTHVNSAAGKAIKAYLATEGTHTAELSVWSKAAAEAPAITGFSSRGPSVSSSGNLLKPDITAPGVDIVAAISPAGNNGEKFAIESGTSMSAPHIAGIAALIRAKHPTWSPIDVKSALMTTAAQLDNAGKPIQTDTGAATPLDEGSGHVTAKSAFDPGIVYESTAQDWLKYTCGITTLQGGDGSDLCTTVGAIKPSDLNYPSIAVGSLTGIRSIKRTVTNVDGRASVYTARVQAPAGVNVKVTPSVLSVPAHGSATFTVDFTRTTAAYGAWATGAITWLDLRGHVARSPIVVRPTPLEAPGEVTGTTVAGSGTVSVTPGFTGTLTATANGLVPSQFTSQKLAGVNKTFNPAKPAEGDGVSVQTVTVPEGTKLARVATFSSDYGPGADLDLFAYDKDDKQVGGSGSETATEAINLPGPGTYKVYVVQFTLPTGSTDQVVKLHTFLVGSTAAGNLKVSPPSAKVQIGVPTTVKLDWTGLTTGLHYLGYVEFGDGTNAYSKTIVGINP